MPYSDEASVSHCYSSLVFETCYDIFEKLGSGQFAVVRRCKHKMTGTEYAAKMIKKRRFNASRRGAKRTDIEREIGILRDIGGHENVISLHEVYETSQDVILVLELVSGGELFDHVCAREHLNEAEASAFVKQILLGVKHLHRRGIVHLDIKPENVMLLHRGSTQVKLIDFGLSRKILPGQQIRDMVGTPEFVAPEIVNYESITPATDMWAIGVVTYILLSGVSPFLGESRDETFCNITAVAYDLDNSYFSHVSGLARDFIRKLFVRDPGLRATVDDCLRHPWISPEVREQIMMERESELNIGHLKSFSARKRWRQSIQAILLCNRTIKIARKHFQTRRRSVHYESKHVLMTALFCASEDGNVPALEDMALLAHVDFSMANELGETAMHIAAGAGQLDVIRFLQVKGAKVTAVDKHGDSALFFAARHNHVEVVEYLIREGCALDQQNKCFETALHIAARYGNHGVAACLCALGANADLKDEHEETPLHIASWHGFVLVMQVLCQVEPNLNMLNKDEETALHCAAARGHLGCVQCLVSSGANVDLQDKNGQTALFHAIRRHHVDIALSLLHAGCQLDIKDKDGNVALHYACKEGLLTIVQALCALGCQLDIANGASLTPLHVAAREGHIEVVRVLCLAGSNIGAKNKDGLTAEIIAFAQGFSSVGELLGRLKNDQQKDALVEQLCPNQQPLKRIKLKVFGSGGVGKTTLLGSLQTSFIGSFFRRRSESIAPKDHYPTDRSPVHKNTILLPHGENYTRGIDVHTMTVSGVGEFSAWEFSGYEPYRQLYDHFVGNTNCLHMVVFKLTDPYEVQYAQVLYWLNFLKARIMPMEPIGHGGCSSNPANVVVIGTHADQVQPPLQKTGDGDWHSHEVEVLLKTIQHRFAGDFIIHERVLLLDASQSGGNAMKMLKNYLSQTKAKISEQLPRSTGYLEAVVTFLIQLRKTYANFPVIGWPTFMDAVRSGVNPLAGEAHCQQMIQQLQLMGEVVYLKSDMQRSDLVVLTPQWICHELIGWLLSAEFLQTCRVTGSYTVDDLQLFFPDVPSPPDLVQVLEALSMCTQYELEDGSQDEDDVVEYEFPAFNYLEAPVGTWEKRPLVERLVYGGVRLQPAHGMELSLDSLFQRVQTQLRRSMREFQDPLEAELCQWRYCSKLVSSGMEGLITLTALGAQEDKGHMAIDVVVRGPLDMNSSCFFLLEDLTNIVEQTVVEIAPGMPLERHFISPTDLTVHKEHCRTYEPQDIVEMQLQHRTTVRALPSQSEDQEVEEAFVDVVCFGAKDVALSLTLGVDLSISQLPLHARRELASLLDPPDSLGRDWSILAVTLGLSDKLPLVDSAGPVVSRTDQILAAWTQTDVQPTIGLLCWKLRELGRKDAVDVLCKCVPLYVMTSADATTPGGEGEPPEKSTELSPSSDSGVVSQNSTSQRSNSSTLSNSFAC